MDADIRKPPAYTAAASLGKATSQARLPSPKAAPSRRLPSSIPRSGVPWVSDPSAAGANTATLPDGGALYPCSRVQPQQPTKQDLRSPGCDGPQCADRIHLHTATCRSQDRNVRAPRAEVTIRACRVAFINSTRQNIRNQSSNDEVERRGCSPASNEGTLSQSSNPSLGQRRRGPAIAPTDC